MCDTLIVFMVGGVTYEESKEVAFLASKSSKQLKLNYLKWQDKR
jgi:hypothetical protein